MNEYLLAVASAFWLGVLTSISPCPLATNIAAMSYLGREVGSMRRVFAGGLLYTLGRVAAYVALGMILVNGLLSVPGIARALQRAGDNVLGPMLIVVGILLLGLIRIPLPSGRFTEKAQAVAVRAGVFSPALLGVVFALAFCPVSAGLFFGSLIPLSVQHGSGVVMPLVYGVATGLPVVGFALVIAFSAASLGRIFNRISAFEWWARRITGVVFIAVGVFQTLRWTFHLI